MNIPKIFNFVLLISWVLVLACQTKKEYPHQHLQVMDIINNTPEETVKILGEPDSAFMQKVVTKNFYTQLYFNLDSLEIQYMDGTAKDIILHKPVPLSFDKKILENYGLGLKDPTSNELGEVYRWENYPDFKVISAYITRRDNNGEISDFRIFFKVK